MQEDVSTTLLHTLSTLHMLHTLPGQSVHLIRRSYSPALFLRVTTSKISSGYFACITAIASVIQCGTVNCSMLMSVNTFCVERLQHVPVDVG